MTSYGKPRWPNTVLFGSFAELNYRIDIVTKGRNSFCIRTHSGPGFRLELVKWEEPPGFKTRGYAGRAARSYWLDNEKCREAVASLLGTHFSRLSASPETIECYCRPDQDILPEGGQLSWCLSLVYLLWSAVPEENRRALRKADFME